MNEGTIRLATISDAAAIRSIYAPFCENSSAVSFETEAPSVEEIACRVKKTLERFPWIVFELDGVVLGYAYAGEHKSRAAYRWSTDASVYLDAAARKRGVGKRLYKCLFEILRHMSYVNVYAGITLPNPASLALHRALGFTELCVYKKVGFKGGAWHDVVWLELSLQEHSDQPVEPLLITQLSAADLQQIMMGC